LPSRFPNLLVNGSSGIAVGMATNIPPHNLGRGNRRNCCFIDNPDAGLDEIIQCIKGPDFPTGGIDFRQDQESMMLTVQAGAGLCKGKNRNSGNAQ
jgi:DNA gyrase/topoisomerase IV subunit A